MSWLSRLFGGNEKKISELENRVHVLEHNLNIVIQAVKNNNNALEKVGELLQAMSAEVEISHERDRRSVPPPKRDKKEYIN